jgi:hypothetical protein
MRNTTRLANIVAAALLLAGSSAFAASHPIHASGCFVANTDPNGNTLANPLTNPQGQLSNSQTGNTVVLWCPIAYELASPPTQVNASVWSNGCINGVPGVALSACRVPKAGGNQVCNSASFNSCTPSINELNASFSGGATGDFFYARVILRPMLSGSMNTLFGVTSN